ncbi:glycosyltransferase family 61 protein [Methylobacterium sp. E-065]|uniref:glycosyltransferase family 61 protein n=1 Tax=Methylobacterium sp. E-065 TaxID=2836583 RepID=UPI001FBB61D0|nr:glycosyltransferase family 61 protein [Methylobacterium sp. E-065]MCJ2016190.1 glycosyltransferase family 61 protein [Methylobacterium sp. E-065]
MLEHLVLAIARRIVDADFYLARNPDVAAAGVDPVIHYAQNWSTAPLRAPNEVSEALIYVWSPLLVLLAEVLGHDRQDITDCFRYRINQLATRRGAGLQLRPALALARYLAVRRSNASRRQGGRSDGLGAPYPVVRIGQDSVSWIRREVVAGSGIFAFKDPEIALAQQPAAPRQIPLPELWNAEVEDASIFGFAQVIARSTFVVYEPEADPRLRYTSRQCEFVINCFGAAGDRVLARFPPSADHAIDAGILLIGRCGANYFHFLIEYATKGYIIDKLSIPIEVPLILSADLFPQELEALRVLFPGRGHVVREHGKRLDVRKLYIPSVMTYIPDTPDIAFWEVAAVNHASLSWLRTRVLSQAPAPASALQRKIYLGRSAGRNITNAAEVEAVFRRHGFEVLNPAQLSFAQQVEAFRSAHYIAGPIGAAFSNLIFASPRTRVFGIVSPFAVQFSIFSSLAAFAQCDYLAIPGTHNVFRSGGEKKRRSLELTHGNYGVDIDYLDRVLDTYS